MSDSGKQSPLGVNVMSGLLQGIGLWVNQATANIVGASTSVSSYTYGTIISNTVLNNLTNAIREGWTRYSAGELTLTTYQNLIAIGSSTIPALGNSPPSNYSGSQSYNISYTGQNASYGYVRLFPWQGYIEFNYNDTLALTSTYTDFLGSFISAGSFISSSNQSISTMVNSVGFLAGTYSNMNDLITADITNVSLSTGVFGRDLINLGKALSLSTISTFGYSSNLLVTLKKNNAITPSLSVALLSTGLTANEIDQISSNVNVTTDQQQKVYSAFLIIGGVDLATILVALNCNTAGLVSLADLLNVKKMFPLSYQTLTVPIYNSVPGPTNSKTYYPIYNSTAVNIALNSPAIKSTVGTIIPSGTPPIVTSTLTLQVLPEGFGSYLQGILPDDIATAAGAFSVSMQQINNINKIDIEKFAQVATSLETIAGLPLTNGTNVPTDTAQTQSALSLVALGGGTDGTYTYSDFFGCMSGAPYDWSSIQTAILNLQTTTLASIYTDLYAATQGPTLGLDALVQTQIDLANAEIAAISSAQPNQSAALNSMYSSTATQLNIEQRARYTGLPAIPSPRVDLFPYPAIIYNFVDLLPNYAKLTDSNSAAQTLEAISNTDINTGQSIIAAMRSSRNQSRLLEIGIVQDDNIPDVLPNTNVYPAFPPNSSVAAVLGIGTLNGLPVPSGDIGIGTLGISQVSTSGPFFEYGPGQGGGPIVPGSLAGSPYTQLIPPALNPVYTVNLLPASISVADAIDQVITCNCDCWVQ